VFNLGDPAAHSCRQCGTVQWYKDGIQHVYRTALREAPRSVLPGRSVAQLMGLGQSASPGLPAPLCVLPAVRTP
jgi:hypothetical protein